MTAGEPVMRDPPRQLDGATVLRWAVGPPGGFYQLAGSDPPVTVAAMAVCRYDDSGAVYLFKCDADWAVVQDWDCGSVEEATEMAEQHARGEAVVWQRFED